MTPAEAAEILAELAADPDRVDDLPRDVLPDVLAAVARVRAQVWSRMVAEHAAPDPDPPAEPEPDRWLDAEAVADRMGVTPRYVYDHADDWPFTRRPSPGKLRFSERGLRRWMDARR